MKSGARIFLVDDHPAVRQGLALLLQQGHHRVCGEAASRNEMLRKLKDCSADIVLLDLTLGTENGLDLVKDIQRLGVPVLVYSMHEDASIISQVFAQGVNGYVCKREVSGVLLEAVRQVLAGDRHVSPFASQILARNVLETEAVDAGNLLSERESQIIGLLGQGNSNSEVAQALHLSIRTIETYCARAVDKLGLAGMKELRRYAIKSTLDQK